MSVLPASQNKRRALIRTLLFVFGGALLALTVAMRVWDAPVQGVIIPLIVVFCILAMLEFTVFDEFSKQTHYVAWYWGSFVGAVAVAVIHILLAFEGSAANAIRSVIATQIESVDPSRAFLSGMMATLLFMVFGFAAVRAVTWLRDR